ncbi:TetR/AcrR family transcriptional regulator C-terminal domain-containing protein [Streptomyces sp. ITFR-16]|uniref:TetR/AcrR family transcriptional regulator n=1 Tax=Streptomyces sp. ITFR-16 TaxID=3075198 RepID=UPI0028894AB8|nr:TetR/AcrR family transcriptional regulator C-terminal domain-containing protein [Streptomyces sp. ITFR-16]WNI23533.1 TetR/AcrR family transcriptional regulator C-terminal domain-containing protein [Streptomyces sp. ITFR-16]
MVSAADRVKDPARTSVWLNHRPPARGRRSAQPAGLDRDRITAASVGLLDAEGLAKFSMRRLAAELNVTAMSLYWYVDTKDDLLELALDSVYSEFTPPPRDAPWEARLRAVATAYRELLVRHVWVSPLAGKFLNLGPHSMLMSHTVQDVIGATGLPRESRTGALSAVFQFVYGFGTVEGQFAQRSAEAGLTQDEYYQQAMTAVRDQPQLDGLVESGQDLIGARGATTVQDMHERDFTFALDLLIAGIHAMRERGASPA